MSDNKHQWKQFSSPRNGRIKVEACEVCGIAKGMVHGSYKCTKEKKNLRLKGWLLSNEDDKKITQSYVSKGTHSRLSYIVDRRV